MIDKLLYSPEILAYQPVRPNKRKNEYFALENIGDISSGAHNIPLCLDLKKKCQEFKKYPGNQPEELDKFVEKSDFNFNHLKSIGQFVNSPQKTTFSLQDLDFVLSPPNTFFPADTIQSATAAQFHIPTVHDQTLIEFDRLVYFLKSTSNSSLPSFNSKNKPPNNPILPHLASSNSLKSHIVYSPQAPFTQITDSSKLLMVSQPKNEFAVLLKELRAKSASIENFGANLMLELFTSDELTDPEVNVTGRVPKGSNIIRRPLDPERINRIRVLVLNQVKGDEALKDRIWKSTKKAMANKLLAIKKAKLNN